MTQPLDAEVDSVLDFASIARSEWVQYQSHVSDWERQRYLASS